MYPEWWGAAESVVQNAARDTAALQACFDAAHNHRFFGPPATPGATELRQAVFTHQRPTIPIVLQGPYLLNAPLYLGERPPASARYPDTDPSHPRLRNPEGFVLRGGAPVGSSGRGKATFLWDNRSTFPSGAEAMLVVRGSYGFTIQDASFDAGAPTGELDTRASRCLLVDSRGGSSQMNALRRCTFRHATRALVQLGPPPPDLTPGALQRPAIDIRDVGAESGGHDLFGLRFEGCNFVAGGSAFGAGASPSQRARLADGVVFRANQSFGVEFDSCAFGGPARAMIRAFGGSFLLTSCVFHTLRVFNGALPESDDEPLGNGADVFLEWFIPERLPGAAFPTRQAAGGFTATNCESQSWRFLLTPTYEDGTGNNYNTVLTNLHHAPVASGTGEEATVTRYPPAIVWDGPARRNAKLLLEGCLLEAGAGLGGRTLDSDARVLLGPDLPIGSVVSVGTRTSAGPRRLFGIRNARAEELAPGLSLVEFG
ncbi:MAG: hypothetical protein HY909_18845 [Deltaproteobacteria bacterium]|nr:hypothetical protein [Deltaproteobacteria bacterium]